MMSVITMLGVLIRLTRALQPAPWRRVARRGSVF